MAAHAAPAYEPRHRAGYDPAADLLRDQKNKPRHRADHTHQPSHAKKETTR